MTESAAMKPMDMRPIKGKSLSYVLVTPDGARPDGSWPLVVFLHGLSTSMYDLCEASPLIDSEGYIYAFPNATYQMPLRGGHYGYSWFEERIGVLPPPPDQPPVDTLLESFIHELLEVSGTTPGNVVIGGFSQGGGVALRFGLTHPELVAGVFCLSGSIHDIEALRAELPAKRDLPIFMAHGRYDTRRFERVDESRRFLEEMGYQPDFGEFNTGHEVSSAVLKTLGRWLHLRLPPRTAESQ